jgi:glycosyltransferase involved in cell wall biosynthesis
VRICLDVSPAIHHRAGIGRYAQELAAALLAVAPEHEYTAFYNRAAEARPDPPLDRLPHLTLSWDDKPWRLRVLLAQLLHRSQDSLFRGADLFHATDHLLPRLSHVRSVFTLHDLTFRLYPQAHSHWNRWFLALMLPRFLRAADALVADSECTRRDAVRLYGTDAAKIRVIYPGVSSRFRSASTAIVRQKYGLPDRFILSASTIEPRKNLITLLEAFAASTEQTGDRRPAARGWKLVVAGKKGWLYEDFFRRLHELEMEGQVALLGFVPDDDLPALYSAADLFVFPSLYEGFGLPALEAMACGTPVIASNTSSLPEVVGDAGLLVDPHDTSGLAAAMEQVLADEWLRAEMRAKGIERAKTFTWEKTAHETLRVYAEVLRK